MADGGRTGMAAGAFEAVWYAHAFLRQFVLVYPVAAIMVQDSGVSALGLATLFMIWSGSALAFEVPTGVLADRVSRRNLLVVSGAVKGCASLVWLAAPDFWGFAAGFVVWSLGSSLHSGTAQAYLYDALAAQRRQQSFERVFGREQAAATGGAALALGLGGWAAAEGGYSVVLVLSAVAPWCGALLVAVALTEPDRHAEVREERFWGTLADGLRELRRGPLVATIVAALALLPTVYEVAEEFVPPLLDERHFSLTGVGLTYAGLYLVRTAGLLLAHRLRRASLPGVCVLLAAAGAVLAAGLSGGGTATVVALAVFFAASGIGDVLLQGRLQDAIQGPARATLTSVAGLGQEMVSLGFYLAIGLVAEASGWPPAMAMMGVWLLVSALTFALIARRLSQPGALPEQETS